MLQSLIGLTIATRGDSLGSRTSTSTIVVNQYDTLLAGGASFIGGHGAPTGVSLRTGNPGTQTTASFPSSKVLTPGCTVSGISFTFRYIVGYESVPSGHGANLSFSISDKTLSSTDGDILYRSPPFTEYAC